MKKVFSLLLFVCIAMGATAQVTVNSMTINGDGYIHINGYGIRIKKGSQVWINDGKIDGNVSRIEVSKNRISINGKDMTDQISADTTNAYDNIKISTSWDMGQITESLSNAKKEAKGWMTITDSVIGQGKELGISEIRISQSALDVVITPSTDHNTSYEAYIENLQVNKPSYGLKFTRTGDILEITQVPNSISLRSGGKNRLTIAVAPSVKILNNSSVSGDVEIKGVEIEKITVNTTSGGISITDTRADGRLNAHSVSGDISINGATSPMMEYSTTSGDISATDASASKINASSVSGDITMSSSDSQKVKVSTTSGDLSYTETRASLTDLSAQSVSGDVRLSLARNADEVSYQINSLSGDISVFDIKARRSVKANKSDAPLEITISTVSGDVKVK